jgi:hypothetical protein
MRIGKRVNLDDPEYAFDKSRGYVRIPTVDGGRMAIQSLKYANRYAYDHHIFEIIIGNEKVRINKDDLLEAVQYV